MIKRISVNKSLVISAIVAFLLDLISKEIVSHYMTYNLSISVIGNFFRLTFLRNRGIAFGLLGGFSNILIWVSLLVIIIILFAFKDIKEQKPIVKISLGLILGGALGNLLDRIRFGSVRDFLDFGLNSNLRWPVFNIADSAVFVGIIFIILFYREKKKAED